jgi:hypothetical protein
LTNKFQPPSPKPRRPSKNSLRSLESDLEPDPAVGDPACGGCTGSNGRFDRSLEVVGGCALAEDAIWEGGPHSDTISTVRLGCMGVT